MEKQFTLVCFAHLSWDNVWQRPQQLMSRFAERCQVIYVDPTEDAAPGESPSLQERPGGAGVQVVCPRLPHGSKGSARFTEFARQISAILDLAGPNKLFWSFSPSFVVVTQMARPHCKLIVYDCMDDFFSAKDDVISLAMVRCEQQMLQIADLLFTGGPSMYEARKARHPRAHCFSSGVDVAHFQQTLDPATTVPEALARIPGPRLGYFGVLDDRIDWPLVQSIATERPEWQWVMIGPKDPLMEGELLQMPNIHYLGQQPYQHLPAYLKGFDVCTMPFAHNALTRFISPTKTPEYLAGGKPVVSSAIRDVVAGYAGIVQVADDVAGWLAAVTAALEETPAQQQDRLAQVQPILERSQWDDIAARMWSLIEAQLAQR